MEKIGYALVALATGEEILTAKRLPCRFTVPGVGVVDFDRPGLVMPDSENPTHVFVERWATEAPSPEHTLESEEAIYNPVAERVNVSRIWAAPPPPTEADYAAAIQAHVDATAQSQDYHDGVMLASYAASTVPTWAAQAAAFVAWRDAVWAYAYEQLAAVQAELRTQPSIAEMVAELPAIVWPE